MPIKVPGSSQAKTAHFKGSELASQLAEVGIALSEEQGQRLLHTIRWYRIIEGGVHVLPRNTARGREQIDKFIEGALNVSDAIVEAVRNVQDAEFPDEYIGENVLARAIYMLHNQGQLHGEAANFDSLMYAAATINQLATAVGRLRDRERDRGGRLSGRPWFVERMVRFYGEIGRKASISKDPYGKSGKYRRTEFLNFLEIVFCETAKFTGEAITRVKLESIAEQAEGFIAALKSESKGEGGNPP